MQCLPKQMISSKSGTLVIALASHQSGIDAICGLSLSLVLFFVLRGFPLGPQVFLSLKTNKWTPFQGVLNNSNTVSAGA